MVVAVCHTLHMGYDTRLRGGLGAVQQIHLGSFNTEEEAAQAFDQEALRLRGPGTFTNFPAENYLGSEGNPSAAPQKPVAQKRQPNGTRCIPSRLCDPPVWKIPISSNN